MTRAGSVVARHAGTAGYKERATAQGDAAVITLVGGRSSRS